MTFTSVTVHCIAPYQNNLCIQTKGVVTAKENSNEKWKNEVLKLLVERNYAESLFLHLDIYYNYILYIRLYILHNYIYIIYFRNSLEHYLISSSYMFAWAVSLSWWSLSCFNSETCILVLTAYESAWCTEALDAP